MVLPPDQHVVVSRSIGRVPPIDRLDWVHAEVLKATDAGSVLRLTVESDPSSGSECVDSAQVLIAKTMRVTGLGDRVKIAVGASRLHRQWRGSKRLGGIVPTAPLIALVTGLRDHQPVATLLMVAVAGPTLLEEMARSAADDLAEPAGRLLGTLARRRLFNRDPKPSNLIVTPDGLVMIDTVAIRPTLRPVRSLARMLTALVLEPTGVGCPPGRDWLGRAIRAGAREAGRDCDEAVLASLVDALVAHHPNPVSRDDPLAHTH